MHGGSLVTIAQYARLEERIVTSKRVVHLSKEAPMVSIPKLIGALSCGLLLCLGLSNIAQAEHAPSASDVMKTDSQSDRQGFQSDDDKQTNSKVESSPAKGAKTITGELVRVKDGNYFVKVIDKFETLTRRHFYESDPISRRCATFRVGLSGHAHGDEKWGRQRHYYWG
jgi:hypothetical protein